MQYQIIDKNNNIVAWIDTKSDTVLVDNEYTILEGEELDATEINGNLKPIIRAIAI